MAKACFKTSSCKKLFHGIFCFPSGGETENRPCWGHENSEMEAPTPWWGCDILDFADVFFSFWGVSAYDFRCFLIFWGDVLDVSFFCWQEPNEEQTQRTREIQLFLVEDVQFIFTIDILTIDSGSTLVTFWNWKTSVQIVTYSMVLWHCRVRLKRGGMPQLSCSLGAAPGLGRISLRDGDASGFLLGLQSVQNSTDCNHKSQSRYVEGLLVPTFHPTFQVFGAWWNVIPNSPEGHIPQCHLGGKRKTRTARNIIVI